jgi:hypothetical protein
MRIIWVDENLNMIYWGISNKESGRKIKGQMETKYLIGLKSGPAKVKKAKDQLKMKRVFSILSKKRNLELEAPTEDAKNLWMGYFEELFRFKGIKLL